MVPGAPFFLCVQIEPRKPCKTMSLGDILYSVPQSKLAGLTILLTLVLISIFILAGKDKISFGQKIAVVLLLVLLALPTILLTLFQINCVVTGAGLKNQRWWCSLYAWIVAALIVFYCIMLVFVSLTSFAKGESVLAKDAAHQAADVMAREFFNTMEGAEEEEDAPETLDMPSVDVLGSGAGLLKKDAKEAAPKKEEKKPAVADSFMDYDGPVKEEKKADAIEGFVAGGYATF